jgi:hypothetical protein
MGAWPRQARPQGCITRSGSSVLFTEQSDLTLDEIAGRRASNGSVEVAPRTGLLRSPGVTQEPAKAPRADWLGPVNAGFEARFLELASFAIVAARFVADGRYHGYEHRYVMPRRANGLRPLALHGSLDAALRCRAGSHHGVGRIGGIGGRRFLTDQERLTPSASRHLRERLSGPDAIQNATHFLANVQ